MSSVLVVISVILIALLAGCPMPEPTPEPDPMPEPNGGGVDSTPPDKMAAPILEAGNTQLRANWTPPKNNGGSEITAYELRHSDDGGSSWSGLVEILAPAVSAAITNLTNLTEYTVQARARNSAGAGDWSGSSDGATPNSIVPTEPNGLVLSVSMQTITAAWTAPTDTGDSAIIRYELQHRVTGARAWEPAIATADADTLTLTITDLTKGTEYEVQVYAVNTDGNGNPTEIKKITIPATVPSTMNAPTLTGGNAQITAAWTAPDDGGSEITAYHVQHRVSAADVWSTTNTDNIADINDGTTSHPITGLTNGASYQVRARAVNDIGTGGWSTPATGTTIISAAQTTPANPDMEAMVNLSAAAMTIITAQSPTVALTTVELGTLAVSGSGDITVTPATTPDTVIVPTVDAGTGVVTVAPTTTAGTYLVYGTESGGGGTDILFAEYFYVTVSPNDAVAAGGNNNGDGGNNELDEAVADGITAWGNTADLNYIITTAVTDMSMVFATSAFNGDISRWNTSAVTTMYRIFTGTSAFNGDISRWNVSSVTNMDSIFFQASAFNGDISRWNVSSATTMNRMFNQASAFDGDISGWDVGKVTNMYSMFYQVGAFNSDVSDWDVSKVTNMQSMFNQARAFNSDVSDWDVSKVTNMQSMFNQARAFNQDLEEWKDHWMPDNDADPDTVGINSSGTYTGTKTNMFLDSGLDANPTVGDDSGEQPNYPSWY
ncbi:MAG: BspA family leucine-rich repeat surface protein [Salinispira sp.]